MSSSRRNHHLVLGLLAVCALAACGGRTAESATTTASTEDAATATERITATTAAPTASEQPTTTAAPTTMPPATTTAPPPPPTAVPTTMPPATTTAPAPPATYAVVTVIDGDTIDVADASGAASRVRLIGIDAPESGTCEGPATTADLTTILAGKQVTLTPGGDGEDSDGYGRLLRYVDVDGVDAGLAMINWGSAVARYDSRDGYGRHDREDAYVAADAATTTYTCAPPPPPVTSAPRTTAADHPAPPERNDCHPAYVECLPVGGDLDCTDVGRLVHLRGTSDPYRLDGNDNDGLGCESYG